MSGQTVLELDSDVEVTDCCDAESKSFHGRASDEEYWTLLQIHH